MLVRDLDDTSAFSVRSSRLYEVIHTEKKLTLVFEYLDQDLKQYMDECMGEISVPTMKV